MTNRFEKTNREVAVFINIAKGNNKLEDAEELSKVVDKLEAKYGFRLECFMDKKGQPCIMLPLD
jgi:hypothetical protein